MQTLQQDEQLEKSNTNRNNFFVGQKQNGRLELGSVGFSFEFLNDL